MFHAFRRIHFVSFVWLFIAIGSVNVAQEVLSDVSENLATRGHPIDDAVPAEIMQLPYTRQLELFADQPLSAFGSGSSAALTNPAMDSYLSSQQPLTVAPFPLTDRPTLLVDRLLRDQCNFYSPDSLIVIGAGLGVGAVIANTSADESIQRHLQSSLRNANSDDWLESLHANKELGDGRYTLPVFAGAWLLGNLLPEYEFSRRTATWGERTLRGFVVGAPPVLVLQHLTGGSRPGEMSSGSHWEPFQDNNGVSGHAFMGALPFITAAKMSDKLVWKAGFYAASTLAPLSRAADRAHYPSQVALGWGLAFMAATAVHGTDNPNARWRLLPTANAMGTGMALEYRF